MLTVFVTLPPTHMRAHTYTEFAHVDAYGKNSDF